MAMNCWWKSWLLDKGYDAGIDIGPLSDGCALNNTGHSSILAGNGAALRNARFTDAAPACRDHLRQAGVPTPQAKLPSFSPSPALDES